MRICLLDSGIGVVPFIKEIIKNDKRNDYIIFMDSSFFPYGDKSSNEMKEHILELTSSLERLNIDVLLVCCNTLSYYFLNNNISASFIIRTILEINMKSEYHLLTTSLLSKEIGSINGENLAYLIENNKIKEIISLIKRRGENNLVMGCTHYSLIKKIFEVYFFNIESNEYELIKNLPSTTLAINLYASIDTIKKINVFFPNLVIKEMDH